MILKDYNIAFIRQEGFERHVKTTIEEYLKSINQMDLDKFNKNIIDPIKLTFDKFVLHKKWKQVIENEIGRQRDKSNNNSIGYFHQNLFKYIPNCDVPKTGFDVIYTKKDGTKTCIELKNKHNTMNSSSSQRTFIKFTTHLLANPKDECYLVEIMAPKSRNIVWSISLDGLQSNDERIRRVSIDQLLYLITGYKDAFYQICLQLPITLSKLVKQIPDLFLTDDTVFEDLKNVDKNLLKALYIKAFSSYLGFESEDMKLLDFIDESLKGQN